MSLVRQLLLDRVNQPNPVVWWTYPGQVYRDECPLTNQCKVLQRLNFQVNFKARGYFPKTPSFTPPYAFVVIKLKT